MGKLLSFKLSFFPGSCAATPSMRLGLALSCVHMSDLHAACRYDWFGDHNLPWLTDLNSVSSAIDWNKINAISASPNTFDNRDPAQTGGGFGLLPWYLRSAAIPRAPRPPAPAGQPVPAPAGQATGG